PHAVESTDARYLHQAVTPDFRDAAPGFELGFDFRDEPDDLVGIRILSCVETMRDGATLVIANLLNRRMKRRATRRMNNLRQAHQIGFGIESGNKFVRLHPFVRATEAVIVKETRGHSLAVKAFEQLPQSKRSLAAIVARHRVRCALQGFRKHVCDDESAWRGPDFETIARAQIIRPDERITTGLDE